MIVKLGFAAADGPGALAAVGPGALASGGPAGAAARTSWLVGLPAY